MDIVKTIVDISTNYIADLGIVFGFFIVLIECFIPVLPLCVFITLNINAFGFFTGLLVSWLATCIGSYLCYLFFYFLEKKYLNKYLNKSTFSKINKAITRFNSITFSQLVLLIALPFTPSYLINIICGISHVNKDKYFFALLIGKVFSTSFWAYIGKSLIHSVTDIYSLIFIGVALVLAYVLSKFVSYNMGIE